MAAGETPGETPTLLTTARRKECGRLDRGHSGVLARVLPGRMSKFADVLACVKGGFVVSGRANS